MEHPHLMTDKDLVRLYQKGDESAFTVLLNRHKEKIFSTIFYLVHNRELAEDLFQETFIKIITKLKEKKYNEEGKFLPWAARVAHNLVIDYFRVNSHMRLVHDRENFSHFDIMPERSRNAAEEMIHNEDIGHVRGFIERLPQHQREVVILRHYGGLSFKEISTTLNININTALGRMHFAVIEMRKMMTGEAEVKVKVKKIR
jgi:RNA polymerase sigma factor (sigma-70 family)